MTCPHCGSDDASLQETGKNAQLRQRFRDCGVIYTVPKGRLTAADWIARAKVRRHELPVLHEAAALHEEISTHGPDTAWGRNPADNRHWTGRTPDDLIRALERDWRRQVTLLRVVLAIHGEVYTEEEEVAA